MCQPCIDCRTRRISNRERESERERQGIMIRTCYLLIEKNIDPISETHVTCVSNQGSSFSRLVSIESTNNQVHVQWQCWARFSSDTHWPLYWYRIDIWNANETDLSRLWALSDEKSWSRRIPSVNTRRLFIDQSTRTENDSSLELQWSHLIALDLFLF